MNSFMHYFLNFNGKLFNAEDNCISPSNRSFRYGDGFFETIKLKQGKILLAELHKTRIKISLDSLKFKLPKLFNIAQIFNQIEQLTKKNSHTDLARIRLTFFRGNGGLYNAENDYPNYIIQTYSLNESLTELNSNGLILDFYKQGIKAIDSFCNLKNNSFMPYTIAALWAKENKLNDAIILNSNHTIADTTIANIFIVKNDEIITPALHDACIAGVKREFILQHFKNVQQKSITEFDVLHADEVFVTNAIRGVQWVRQISNTFFDLGPKTMECYNLIQQLQNKK